MYTPVTQIQVGTQTLTTLFNKGQCKTVRLNKQRPANRAYEHRTRDTDFLFQKLNTFDIKLFLNRKITLFFNVSYILFQLRK